ncbi:adhesive plaque matrix protein-like [Bacillus rossius redtenbacheri]|uniref:adhesive plaque matrix protein-like n=1 Tax=Bacillus rossius redtenbacheri TaxID=93214 RepID=UPI002FDCD245
MLLAGSHLAKILLLAAAVSCQQYARAPPQYQVQDSGDSPQQVDYTAYLGPPAPAKAQAAEEKGFLEPIDFSGLFAGASSGVAALSPSSGPVLRSFFPAAGGDPFSALGSATSHFPAEVEAVPNNGSGFTSPQVQFQSLFDVSGSAPEAGFRPQDFLQPKKASEDEQGSEEADAYSPSYDYKSPYAKAAPGYRGGAKDHELYRASPSGESPGYRPEYTAGPPKYLKNKYVSEVAPGKSSYPAPPSSPALYSSPGAYRPVSSESRPEKAKAQEESYGGYSSYAPPNTEYRSDASAAPQGKSIYPVPSSAYGAKSSESNASPNEKRTYTSSPSDIYKQFGIEASQPSTISQASPNTAIPQAPKTPSASFGIYPSVSTTLGSYLPQATDYSSVPSNQGPNFDKRGAGAQPKEASATENQEKKCKKVEKHVSSDDIVKGRFRRDAMSCFVCEDPKTKLSYEKCSYEPEPQGSNYFKGHTQSYKVNLAKAPGFRFRRDLAKIIFDFEKEWNLESTKIYPRKVRQPSASGYGYSAKDGYKYGPDYFGPYYEDKYSSPAEYTPSASAPDPKNCKKVEKDKMTCYECTDPKNGGTYEQCSYSAKPKDKNYFIAHETSFNKDSKHDKPQTKNERNRRGFAGNGDGVGEASSRIPREDSGSGYGYKADVKASAPASSEGDKSYYSPSEFSTSESKENKNTGPGYEPYAYSGPDYYNAKDKTSEGSGRVESYFEPGRNYDEYFRKLFPELVEAEKTSASTDDSERHVKPLYTYTPSTPSESQSQHLKSAPPGFFTNNENKKDLEKVLGEFSKKDWSSCKKVNKDKMTCYQCVDKNGLQHEECMFVAASEPKTQHLAYHEKKEFSLIPPEKSRYVEY